jgi:hypothetical protein
MGDLTLRDLSGFQHGPWIIVVVSSIDAAATSQGLATLKGVHRDACLASSRYPLQIDAASLPAKALTAKH